MDVVINYWAILACGVAAMVLGYVWYSMWFLGSAWMKANGYTKTELEKGKDKMGMSYGLMFIASLVVAYVLAHVMSYMGVTTMSEAVTGAFWIWLGFFAAGSAGRYLFPAKPFMAYAIEVGYHLIILVVMAWILQAWM